MSTEVKTFLCGYSPKTDISDAVFTVGVKTWNEVKKEEDFAVINVITGPEADELFNKITTVEIK